MKSTVSMPRLLGTLLLVSVISAACAHANTVPTPTPTFIPLDTSTPTPTSTLSPSPTLTETPTLTPTPILVSVIQDTFLYSGPGSAGYEKITHLPIGTSAEPLGEFVDFVLVRLPGTDPLQEGYVPTMMLAGVPALLPYLPVEQLPWKVFMSLVSPVRPIEEQNNSDAWVGTTMAHGVWFTDGLQIKLNIEVVKGSIGIVLQGTGEGNPWWNGQKRIEIFYADGSLQMLVRDGTQEKQIYDGTIPLKMVNGVTTGEVTITFDQFGKNMHIAQDNQGIFQLAFGNVGNFPNGLFPQGEILGVTLSTGPQTSGRLTELAFAAPPDGKYKK